MIVKKEYLIFALLILIMSCAKSKKNEKKNIKIESAKTVVVDKELNEFKKSSYFDYDRVMESKYKVVKNGDKFAYADLVLFYSYNKSKQFEILPYSLIMVEKHKKYYYCSNVFENILEFYTGQELGNYYDGKEDSSIRYLKNIELLNKEQKEYALYFLNLGANNNDFNSISYLEIINRNGLGVEINLKKADNLKKILLNLEKERELKISKKQ